MLTTLSVNWIVSQNTQNTVNEPSFFSNSRSIKYRVLNEALKIAKSEKLLKENDSVQKETIARQDSIIKALTKVNEYYENNIVPNLEHQIALYEQKEVSNEKLYSIENEKWQLKYDKLKSKKLGVGFSAGYGVTPTGLQPSVNFSLNYTLFRL